MKKLSLLTLIFSLIVTAGPALAKGKPDHAGGPGNESDPPTLSVCIDAGHGGTDSGTISPDGTILESNLNLDVARELAVLLEDSGFTTHMTRNAYNETHSNNDRYTFCNATDASTLISIHHNGSTNQSVDYTSGLYHQGSSKKLAEMVGISVAESFGQADTFRTERYPSGVLIKSDMPSMMSEGYFLTNTARASALYADYDSIVIQEAMALRDGVIGYYDI